MSHAHVDLYDRCMWIVWCCPMICRLALRKSLQWYGVTKQILPQARNDTCEVALLKYHNHMDEYVHIGMWLYT
jgi:hypothetical protein